MPSSSMTPPPLPKRPHAHLKEGHQLWASSPAMAPPHHHHHQQELEAPLLIVTENNMSSLPSPAWPSSSSSSSLSSLPPPVPPRPSSPVPVDSASSSSSLAPVVAVQRSASAPDLLTTSNADDADDNDKEGDDEEDDNEDEDEGTLEPPPPLVTTSSGPFPERPALPASVEGTEAQEAVMQRRLAMLPITLYGANVLTLWHGRFWPLFFVRPTAVVLELDDVMGLQLKGQIEDDLQSPTIELFYTRQRILADELLLLILTNLVDCIRPVFCCKERMYILQNGHDRRLLMLSLATYAAGIMPLWRDSHLELCLVS